jgi:hypothetical protein
MTAYLIADESFSPISRFSFQFQEFLDGFSTYYQIYAGHSPFPPVAKSGN